MKSKKKKKIWKDDWKWYKMNNRFENIEINQHHAMIWCRGEPVFIWYLQDARTQSNRKKKIDVVAVKGREKKKNWKRTYLVKVLQFFAVIRAPRYCCRFSSINRNINVMKQQKIYINAAMFERKCAFLCR